MKIIFISWAGYCSRSDNIARELGGQSYMIYTAWLGSNIFTIWLKYFVQLLKTFYILISKQPDVVFVMSPPVFAVFTVATYSFFARVPYVIDAHTAAFLHPRWKHWQWFQRIMSRHASTNIVTNEHLAQYVRAGGGHATIIRDVPVVYSKIEDFPLDEKFSVVVVCSFNYDEPVEEILNAASQLPEMRFYMTGDPKFIDKSLLKNIPDNVMLTGFISDAAYGSLLTNANTVMTLTTRDHTMLRGAYEAVYQETPIIISNWKILREVFHTGAIYVDNTVEGIVESLYEMKRNYDRYKEDVSVLKRCRYEEWDFKKNILYERTFGSNEKKIHDNTKEEDLEIEVRS